MQRAFPKKLVITLLVVLGLLVAADFGAAAVAENRVATKLGDSLELGQEPEVRINGFPFLTQAARGDFRDVWLDAPGVDAGPLSDVDVQADLHHARVDTFAMIGGGSSRIDIAEVVGRARIDESTLQEVLPVQKLSISPTETAADPGEGSVAGVRLEGVVGIAGVTNRVTVTGRLVVADGGIRIEPRRLDLNNDEVGSVELAGRFERAILGRFTTTLEPGMLPFDVRPTEVHVERGALVVEGTAHDVTVNGPGTGN